MRKIAAAALAVPVLALVYLGMLVHRSTRMRMGVALVAILLGGGWVLGSQGAGRTVARPPSPVAAVADAVFTSRVIAGETLASAVTIAFGGPMNERSVGALLTIDPASDVETSWDPAGSILTVRPAGSWEPGTYYTVTVDAGALEASGRPTASPVRVSFLTRQAVRGVLAAAGVTGSPTPASASFTATFDAAVDPATVMFVTSPSIGGTTTRTAGQDASVTYTFVPSSGLQPSTTYRIALASGIRDADGAPVAAPAALAIRTPDAPAVVRFSPASGTAGVSGRPTLSVRFSVPMERTTTAAAWKVVGAGVPVAGSVSWAEQDAVLVFTPTAALPAGRSFTMTVGSGATSKTGLRLSKAASATFSTSPPVVAVAPKAAPTIAPKVAPKPTLKPAPKPSPAPTSSGSVGAGTWLAVEQYYLGLMNCTRTGGWVTSAGACSSPGGRAVAPLILDAGISSKVSRPYAEMLATTNQCSHFIGGNPGDRLRAAGYTSWNWAENLGCQSQSGRTLDAAMVSIHLYFQNEANWSPPGGHYVNMMNALYDRVGIGVWVSGGQIRLVIDFYRPL